MGALRMSPDGTRLLHELAWKESRMFTVECTLCRKAWNVKQLGVMGGQSFNHLLRLFESAINANADPCLAIEFTPCDLEEDK